MFRQEFGYWAKSGGERLKPGGAGWLRRPDPTASNEHATNKQVRTDLASVRTLA